MMEYNINIPVYMGFDLNPDPRYNRPYRVKSWNTNPVDGSKWCWRDYGFGANPDAHLISYLDGSFYYFNANYSEYYDDIKRGRSIYISPNGIDGWTRMSPPNTRLGPKVMFTTVDERNAQFEHFLHDVPLASSGAFRKAREIFSSNMSRLEGRVGHVEDDEDSDGSEGATDDQEEEDTVDGEFDSGIDDEPFFHLGHMAGFGYDSYSIGSEWDDSDEDEEALFTVW